MQTIGSPTNKANSCTRRSCPARTPDTYPRNGPQSHSRPVSLADSAGSLLGDLWPAFSLCRGLVSWWSPYVSRMLTRHSSGLHEPFQGLSQRNSAPNHRRRMLVVNRAGREGGIHLFEKPCRLIRKSKRLERWNNGTQGRMLRRYRFSQDLTERRSDLIRTVLCRTCHFHDLLV